MEQNNKYSGIFPEQVGVKYKWVEDMSNSIFNSPNPYYRKSASAVLEKLVDDVVVDYDNVITQKRIANDQMMTNYTIDKDNKLATHKFNLENRALQHKSNYIVNEDKVLTKAQDLKYARDLKSIENAKALVDAKKELAEGEKEYNAMIANDSTVLNAREKTNF